MAINYSSDFFEDAKKRRDLTIAEGESIKSKIIEDAKEAAIQEGSRMIEVARAEINRIKDLMLMDVAKMEANTICREIIFPPNLVSAGLNTLNQFSAIINKKYAGIEIKIRIEQNQDKIVYFISTPDGETIEKIEHDLNTFGKILKGEQKIEDLVSDPMEIINVRHRLDMVALELKLIKEFHALNARQTALFEHERSQFYGLLDKSFSHGLSNTDLIKELITYSGTNQQLKVALLSIQSEIAKEHVDEHVIITSLEAIKNVSPEKAKKVGEYIITFLSTTASATIVELIKKFLL